MDKYLLYDTFPFRHVQFQVCFIMLSFLKIWTNMKFVWVCLYWDIWVNYTIDITWIIGCVSVFGEESFYQSLRFFFNLKKKVWTVGLKRRPVVETGSENESYTIKWQYDMIPSCKITASRKKNHVLHSSMCTEGTALWPQIFTVHTVYPHFKVPTNLLML